MADTSALRQVEQYVCMELQREYGAAFRSRVLTLRTGGTHQFDVVSDDERVVAAVKSASGRTSGGKNPSGKIRDCLAELYYLGLIDAPIRLLVLTTPEFHDLFMRQMMGRIDPEVKVRLISLPDDLQRTVSEVQSRASSEVQPH